MPRKNHPTSLLPQFEVIVGTCLGVKAYRGFGLLSDLARISRADIFDQVNNRFGTQRNLSVTHARKAYEYVADNEKAFYPEIILNIRDESYINLSTRECHNEICFAVLSFIKDPSASQQIIVSRLDGNHRLWFTDGHDKSFEPVGRSVSFCFVVLPKIEDELELFRDINDNQMGMNTSHLENITARLLGEKVLKVKNPAAYIVQKLQKDPESPLYKQIHEGGIIRKGSTLSGLTIANLTLAVKDMLTRSARLSQFPDTDAQFEVIKNYWKAVQKWLPNAWKHPRDYIIFKGVGLYAISYVGIEIIDRCLNKGMYEPKNMLRYLNQIPNTAFLSTRTGLAYAGRGGGRKMANDLIANLEEQGEVSLSRLQKMILGKK